MPHDPKRLQKEIAQERVAPRSIAELITHGELLPHSDLPRDPQECPDCGGQGWWAEYRVFGDPPEQVQCEKCWGTGSLDPRAGGENAPKADPNCRTCKGTGEYRSDLETGLVRCGCVPADET